jgi:hypothetical protein
MLAVDPAVDEGSGRFGQGADPGGQGPLEVGVGPFHGGQQLLGPRSHPYQAPIGVVDIALFFGEVAPGHASPSGTTAVGAEHCSGAEWTPLRLTR